MSVCAGGFPAPVVLELERRLLEKANTEPSSSELRFDLMPDSISRTCNTNATRVGALLESNLVHVVS